MENKHKSFRLSFFQPTDTSKKWWQFRSIDTREYGYTAILLILSGIVFKSAFFDFLSFIGLICGVIWIIRKFLKK